MLTDAEIKDYENCSAVIAETIELIRQIRARRGYQRPHLVVGRETDGRWSVKAFTHRNGSLIVKFTYKRLFFSLMAFAGYQRAMLGRPRWWEYRGLVNL